MVRFIKRHLGMLKICKLIATGTTGQVINEKTQLKVQRMASGTVGGDQMIGAEFAQDRLDCVIFLRYPFNFTSS